jgi:transposase
MFLKCSRRRKHGKIHEYWSIVENRRVCDGRVLQRHVLYLGEINSSQEVAWRKTIEVFGENPSDSRTVALFPADRPAPLGQEGQEVVQIQLDQLQLRRPRQWGACWLACELYRQLQLDQFWQALLPPSREGTRWDQVLQLLVCYRLIDPGSEWRLHRQWYLQSAMGDLLGSDFRIAAPDTLYRCLDRILEQKSALFSHLQSRWKDLFGARFEVLLYDLTSTYFEIDAPEQQTGKRRFGHSRDKRSDCVQVVIGLVVSPEGLPLSYEVLAGNTADKTTLRPMLEKIEAQYGKAQRIWVMDRGIPTEEVLQEMRGSDPPVQYLVGTPRSQLSPLIAALADQPWQLVREGVEVKLHTQEGEVLVLAQSQERVSKERGMRRRQLKRLWARLKELAGMKRLSRDGLIFKLGAAREKSPAAWRLVEVDLPKLGRKKWSYKLNRPALRQARQRDGRYLLRTNLKGYAPEKLWEFYVQLVQVEEAFKNLKGDLAVRPIYHQKDPRMEAHIFVAFLAYCLHVSLRQKLRAQAPGLTARSVLEKFAAVQMVDVHLPTTDGREVVLSRYTQPEAELSMLLHTLKLDLPAQPPPRITQSGKLV